ITREAFGDPKRRRLLLPRIIVGKHLYGPEAFDVPHMKEFMCSHADEGFWLEIVELTADHDMGVVVLQTSGGIGLGRREEIKINVLVVGQIVEHGTLRFDNSCQHLS